MNRSLKTAKPVDNRGRKRPSAPPISITKNRRRYDGGGKVK